MTPKLIYLVSEDWYFLSHRLPMARAAREAGFEVHVVTRVVDGGGQIQSEGFALHPISWRRGSTSPAAVITTIREVRRVYRNVRPCIVHHVASTPAVLGSVAAFGLRMQKLNALAGLGFVFTSNSVKARLLRPIVRRALAFLLTRPKSTVLVQNSDDRAVMMQLGISREHIVLIPGSGVDIERLIPLAVPNEPFTVGFVGRLLYDKGVQMLVEAQELLRCRGVQARLLIAGDPDPANPTSISTAEIDEWRRRPGIEILGHVPAASVWERAHVAALPSRREGLPLSLLEAAACGRPIVATDVPGCREIAREGVNALLVPPDDPKALANAIARLAHDAPLRARFGAAGRRLVETEFSSERIGREVVAVYDRLLERSRESEAST